MFSGEYHGFAKAESKQKALDGEFYFFSKLLKFDAADKGIEVSFTDTFLFPIIHQNLFFKGGCPQVGNCLVSEAFKG